MESNDTIHVSEIIDGIEGGVKTVVQTLRDKGLTLTRVEHAAISILALTNVVMNAANMATHPAGIGSFLIQLGFRFLHDQQQTAAPKMMPSVSVEGLLPPDLEVVNLQADPPKPTGL